MVDVGGKQLATEHGQSQPARAHAAAQVQPVGGGRTCFSLLCGCMVIAADAAHGRHAVGQGYADACPDVDVLAAACSAGAGKGGLQRLCSGWVQGLQFVKDGGQVAVAGAGIGIATAEG